MAKMAKPTSPILTIRNMTARRFTIYLGDGSPKETEPKKILILDPLEQHKVARLPAGNIFMAISEIK